MIVLELRTEYQTTIGESPVLRHSRSLAATPIFDVVSTDRTGASEEIRSGANAKLDESVNRSVGTGLNRTDGFSIRFNDTGRWSLSSDHSREY